MSNDEQPPLEHAYAVLQYASWREANPGRGVPAGFVTASGFALGTWVRRMRAARRAGTLAAGRVCELEALGFTWSGDEDRRLGQHLRSAHRWSEMLGELDDYLAEHGDVIVPAKHITASGNRLGAWLSTQQRAWRRGNLTIERCDDLHRRGVRPTRDETLQVALDRSPVLAVHDPVRRHLP
ncbi:helicase associated domain-containing protein [Dietzia maris]|uniref:helicase associated domain-containing protein n=1 Tax=Dietzia maris TaxID=37915 RepID=UPI0034504E5E